MTSTQVSRRTEVVGTPAAPETASRITAASLRVVLDTLRRRLDDLLRKSGAKEAYHPAIHEIVTNASGALEQVLELIEALERELLDAIADHEKIEQRLAKGSKGPKSMRKKEVSPQEPKTPQRGVIQAPTPADLSDEELQREIEKWERALGK